MNHTTMDIPCNCPTCGPGWAKIMHWQRHTIRVLSDRREVRYDCGHTVDFPPQEQPDPVSGEEKNA